VSVAIAWVVAGVVLLAVELHHFAFYALFAAAGCFAAAIVAIVGPDAFLLQALAAVVVAGAGIVVVRPRVSAAFLERRGSAQPPGVYGGLVGQEVVTLDRVGDPDNAGHVRLAGERWLAVSGAGTAIPAGTTVLITAVDGTTLVVWPVDGHVTSEEEQS
jgi:membrane protein implicated in regulation of membrane protease activity